MRMLCPLLLMKEICKELFMYCRLIDFKDSFISMFKKVDHQPRIKP